MIELRNDELVIRFPEVHEEAVLRIAFQRTLRIPDDGRDHRLPPGLGKFPVRHVDDFARDVPARWLERGGVMLPMHRSEALWIAFSSTYGYPFAVKVAAGKVNAVTGEDWDDGIHRDPQDYLTAPDQPWLDGYCVEKGVIRQFVAQPLGAGYTAEEQLTGAAEHGGIQIVAYPLKAAVWERESRRVAREIPGSAPVTALCLKEPDMGLAAGGRMRQEIYADRRDLADWDTRTRSRCFVHLADAAAWRAITGEAPPTRPPAAADYTRAGLPWFDWYDPTLEAVDGSDRLRGVESVADRDRRLRGSALPENESVDPQRVIRLRRGLREGQVREGAF